MYYLIFAVTTALVSWYRGFRPILNEAIEDGVDNELTNNPIMANLVFIGIETILAPYIFYTIFDKSAFDATEQGLRRIIMKDTIS